MRIFNLSLVQALSCAVRPTLGTLALASKDIFTPLEESYSEHGYPEYTQRQNCLTDHLRIKIESNSKIVTLCLREAFAINPQ
jgi:hypothetical protein